MCHFLTNPCNLFQIEKSLRERTKLRLLSGCSAAVCGPLSAVKEGGSAAADFGQQLTVPLFLPSPDPLCSPNVICTNWIRSGRRAVRGTVTSSKPGDARPGLGQFLLRYCAARTLTQRDGGDDQLIGRIRR
ncbi:hypothetical protein FQA47_006374 [Oryzias melastigma]|uniref:Uncharacterized protein n=1 Tax=Oryzias melastigma TaxID=30732 RepID=A0A834C639_ORYME|nr:hypothetical protein FQA47_006374 [Oryzias melastigma]